MLCALLLFACKGKEQVTTTTNVPATEQPSWVKQRPVNDQYYIGIGIGMRTRPDAMETAKKNALNDMASEITVNISGNSLLYTLDRKYKFEEEFTSTIQATTSERLEGFELVDTWENEQEYWSYYRLSKAEHARIKAERKTNAQGQAKDLHSRARQALEGGDMNSAFDLQLRALLAIREYWGDEDRTDLDGVQVLLANELFSGLQGMASNIRLKVLPERCELSMSNDFQRNMLVTAEFNDVRTIASLKQLPLVVTYPTNGSLSTERKRTDQDGHLRTIVHHLDPQVPDPELRVRVDLEEMVPVDLDQAFVRPLVGNLAATEVHVPITLIMPKVFMEANESNFGSSMGDNGLAPVLREEMTRAGFRFTDSASGADLILRLTSSTRQGGESSGFFTAYLDMNVVLLHGSETIYEGGRQGVKGVQLNYTKAGTDAFRKAAEQIKVRIAPALMDALL